MKTFTKIFLFLMLIVTTSACSGQYSAPGPNPDADPCQTNPCENGGTCKQDKKAKDGYKCTCNAGFMGDKCEVKDPCNPTNPCQNNGTCAVDKTATNGYKCTCKNGYSGDICELRSCNTYTPAKPACQNGGICKDDTTEGHKCDCSATPYSGKQCDESPCDSNPCQNDGTCTPTKSKPLGYGCTCKTFSGGDQCEQRDFSIKIRVPAGGGDVVINMNHNSGYSVSCDKDAEPKGYTYNSSSATTVTCSYSNAKEKDFEIMMTGIDTVPKIQSGAQLTEVVDWGTVQWKSMNGAFSGCTELTSVGTTKPNLSQVTDMSAMFYGTTKFNSSLNHWDVSHVTNMSNMFNNASAFDQPLDKWDVSHVTNMSNMFNGATSFNQDLTSWQTKASSVTNCSSFALGTKTTWITGKPTKLGNCTF